MHVTTLPTWAGLSPSERGPAASPMTGHLALFSVLVFFLAPSGRTQFVPLTLTLSLGPETLVNPSFEADGVSGVNPPAAWSYYIYRESPDGTLQDGDWEMSFTPLDGTFVAGKVTNWGTPFHGFHQTVGVNQDSSYECTAYVYTLLTGGGPAGQGRLGVDPSGGTYPGSPSVQWTSYVSSTGGWTQIGFQGLDSVTATGSSLTLFLEIRQDSSVVWNSVLFDLASVRESDGTPVPTSPPPPTHTPSPTVTPAPTDTDTPVPTYTTAPTETAAPTPYPTAAVCPDRPHIYGCGLYWAEWLPTEDLPPEYQSNPRGYNQAQMDLIWNMGGTMCHGTFDWIDIEATQGVYDWTLADQRVADAVAHGLTTYAYIGNTPQWARPPNGLPGYRTPPDEAYQAEFEAYCSAVAARYAGQVDHFFFWNEPNGCSWINEECANSDGYPLYTLWLKRAYSALKAGNPECSVGAGVLDYHEGVPNGWQYIQGMYDEGAQGYFDAIAIHPYATDGIHWQAILDTRSVMVANGDADKEIWINEYGWPDSGSASAPTYLTAFLDEIKEPEYHYVTMCRYLVMGDLPGGLYGLCNRELTPRPIYNAFQVFEKSCVPTYTPSATVEPSFTPTLEPTHTSTPSETPVPPTQTPGGVWGMNFGFETGDKTGWTDEGDGGSSINHTTWGPGSSWKDNDGDLGGAYWVGRDGAPMHWGLSQAISGVSMAEHIITVGINCGDRGGSAASQQLRIAEGDVTGTCTGESGTQVASHGGVIAAWGVLSGNYTPGSSTITVILWADNYSSDGWDGNCGIDFDGLTIERTTDVREWSLY